MKKKTRRGILSLILALLMLTSAVVIPSYSKKISFSDFSDLIAGEWYEEGVSWGIDSGYFNGKSDTLFYPNDNMTRGEFITLIGRYEEIDITAYEKSESTFTDVSLSKYYSPYIEWGSEKGLVGGIGGGLFDPESPITREQLCALFNRYATFKQRKLQSLDKTMSFDDAADISDWAMADVAAAFDAGLIFGMTETTFVPKGNTTRAQVAVMLYRFKQAFDNGTQIKKILSTYFESSWGSLSSVDESTIASLDIINYHGLNVNPNSTVSNVSTRDFATIASIKETHPNLKIVLVVSTEQGNAAMFDAFGTDTERQSMVAQIMSSVETYGFDGVDVDWEFPNGGADTTAHAETMLLLRSELDKLGTRTGKDYILSAALPGTIWAFQIFDMDRVEPVLDYINLMTYDNWVKKYYAVHHTAAYEDDFEVKVYDDVTDEYLYTDLNGESIAANMELYKSKGIDLSKILAGCAMYTLEKIVSAENNADVYGMEAMASNENYFHYNELAGLLNGGGYTRYWDDTAKAPFMYNGNSFLSYDDDESLLAKAELVNDYGAGGLMIWESSCFLGTTISVSMRNWLDGNSDYPPCYVWESNRAYEYPGIG